MADLTADLTASDGGDLTTDGVGDHWTDLANYTDSVRNIIARPGTFTTLFPETTDDGLVQLLQDALAECHLEGALIDFEADQNGLVRPLMTSGQAAMVVLYAGIRLLRGELLNRITASKYVAGPVSAETTYATNVLRDIMKALQAQKTEVTNRLSTSSAASAFYMGDSYAANAFAPILVEGYLRPGWV